MKQAQIDRYLHIFAQGVGTICGRTPLAGDRPLKWTVIANPIAGGFVIRSRWKEHQLLLARSVEKALSNPPITAEPSQTARLLGGDLGLHGLVATEHGGHAAEIVKALLQEAMAEEKAEKSSLYLLITAGGDGTVLEALGELYGAPEPLRERFVVLRLPLGTGNDGADSPEIDAALDRLILPAKIVLTRALRLCTATPGKGPYLAFNILSVGLDAFVTHMTNKMKTHLPGDSYKLWVDLAALFYDRIYHVDYMDVTAYDEQGGLVKTFREKVLLLAVGATGNRTYGSHKRILPDQRNVCGVKQMPLLRKIALKDLFTTGAHVHKPESILFNAAKVQFRSSFHILAQMDGETVLLEPKDFPASIELTEPAIPALALL
jgi:diacylglycerol kinase family enzyme